MTTYLFRFTIIVNGTAQEQYTERMTQAHAWRMMQSESAELAQMYSDYRVRVEQVD